LNIQLELTSKLLASGDNEEAANSLNLAREAARMSLADVRNTVRSIREEDFSLEQSVQAITERIAKQQEIAFEVKIDEKNLSSPCRHNLLMILQECLTNIQKHSQASKVTIELDASPREAHLTVRDNGKGFQRNGLGTGCGIKGMEERAISLGGAVDISSKPGSGTAVVVKLPT
jgi:signal transduction histidine kinase